MTASPSMASMGPLVVWVGEPVRALRSLRSASVPNFVALSALGELPSVVVLTEGACGWSLEDCLVQAAAPALSTMGVVVIATSWSSGLSWRVAEAGGFCCLAHDAADDEVEAAFNAAAREARRRQLHHQLVRFPAKCLSEARFHYQTLEDADALASSIASVLPDAQRSQGGVMELLVNAIEHGNLGIGFSEKRSLLTSGTLLDEVNRRLVTPPWSRRVATVELSRTLTRVRLTVIDEGEGFDFGKVLATTPELTALHGRGIYLARTLCFDRLWYEDTGNRVVGEVDLP